MEDIKILDNYVDDREFRNYIHSILMKHEFKRITIDDVTLCDDDEENDNDIIAFKDGKKYTVQTFLNRDITLDEIIETVKDIGKENTKGAIIITNKSYDDIALEYAIKNNILIWGREKLQLLIDIANCL